MKKISSITLWYLKQKIIKGTIQNVPIPINNAKMALYFEVNPIKSKEEYLYFVLETFYESANNPSENKDPTRIINPK